MKAQQIPRKVRDIVRERSGGVCEKCGIQPAAEIHHRCGRQMGGSREPWINQPSNLLHLCSGCHGEVTNTRGARAYIETCGWLVRRGQTLPADVPVVLWHGLVLLDDHGGFRTPELSDHLTEGAVS
ncbi:HNH endonuclease [Amycolatopsis taiwanensis]|uniref:HNH endonuclease n=1 Tax=Amycolatopsis taiwanensis TaxID=342230 RepID=UPI0004AED662|nr:HNH endonuclease [Amycolatopsis taiwanensis]